MALDTAARNGPPVTDEHGTHSTAETGPKRLSKRLLIIALAVVLAVLVGIWVVAEHNSATQAASKRRSDASRAIPVRIAAATTGSVDRNVDALGTVTALTASVAGATATTTGTGAGTGGNQTAAPTQTSDRVSLSAAWELDVWGRIRRPWNPTRPQRTDVTQAQGQLESARAAAFDLASSAARTSPPPNAAPPPPMPK
jgi:hypothetical protein